MGTYPLNKFSAPRDLGGGLLTSTSRSRTRTRSRRSRTRRPRAGQSLFLNNGILVPFARVPGHGDDPFSRSSARSRGQTSSLAAEIAPSLGGSLGRQTLRADVAELLPPGLDLDALRPARLRVLFDRRQPARSRTSAGTRSCGATPTCRFSGNQAFFANVELRLPLINLAATPIGLIGPVRAPSSSGSGAPSTRASSTSSAPTMTASPTSTIPCSGSRCRGFHLVDGTCVLRLRVAGLRARLPPALRLGRSSPTSRCPPRGGSSSSGSGTTSERGPRPGFDASRAAMLTSGVSVCCMEEAPCTRS